MFLFYFGISYFKKYAETRVNWPRAFCGIWEAELSKKLIAFEIISRGVLWLRMCGAQIKIWMVVSLVTCARLALLEQVSPLSAPRPDYNLNCCLQTTLAITLQIHSTSITKYCIRLILLLKKLAFNIFYYVVIFLFGFLELFYFCF